MRGGCVECPFHGFRFDGAGRCVVSGSHGGISAGRFALQAGVVATASRAGLLASMVIGLWAALDRRLPRPTAWLLWITALGGLVMTIGRAVMTPATTVAYVGPR